MTLDEINSALASVPPTGVEPIDDPSEMVDFWDWADVVGCVDDFVPDYDKWALEIGE